MKFIKFELGKNIHETARLSGAPEFDVSNTAGLISYEIMNLAPDVGASYVASGYEVTFGPLFALSLYADEDRGKALLVDSASLQLSNKALTSHEQAYQFVQQVIAQFQQGKWKRHIPETCPRLTGKSSIIRDEDYKPLMPDTRYSVSFDCPLDPDLKFTIEEWKALLGKEQQHWMWE